MTAIDFLCDEPLRRRTREAFDLFAEGVRGAGAP